MAGIKCNPELKYTEEDGAKNTKQVFDKPMTIKEIEEFKLILAKSYKRNPSDVIWSSELDEKKKPTGNIIYYVKVMDIKTGKVMRDEETKGERLRQIFSLNIKGINKN